MMEIFNLQNTRERLAAINLCKNLLEKNALIPVVGSGFSLNTQTDNKGRIPSSSELKELLCTLIEMFSGYRTEDIDRIKAQDLPNVADTFWNIYDRIPNDNLATFFSYIETNFLGVSFFKEFQEAFLRVRWPYLFTLNYDTLIEDCCKEYYPIIPFDAINRRHLTEKTILYKIHGDAKKYITTGDQRYLILSHAQYVKSMMDPLNKDMLSELQTAFSSKSILFFGCGLFDELDLLYSSQLAIDEKVKNLDPVHQAVIYINYEHGNNDTSTLTQYQIDILSKYGITHVIRVFTENQSTDFFNELAEHSMHVPQPGIESYLEKYSAIQHCYLESDDIKSRDFMFQENLVWSNLSKHTITLPGYIINRSQMKSVADYVSCGEPVCFISGNFYSGKTYLLIELSKYFDTKKVYIFPSGTDISDAQLEYLLRKEGALFCFDSKTLSTAQIKKLSSGSKLDEIKMHHSCAIVVVDASDAPMYKYIFEARNTAREFPNIRISGVLDDEEEPLFNQNIGKISLPPYSKEETLLDYVVRNEKELMMSSDTINHFLEPHRQLLATSPHGRIKALIMLATEIRISAKRAIQFGIDGHINDIIRCCHETNGMPVIEKDYSIYSGDSSGFEFVCNSKYWIMRALSTYTNARDDSIDVVAEAYRSIVDNYHGIYKDDDVGFYQKCEPYYFFDHIQLLFNYRWFSNPAKLMNAIYDRLLALLSNSYQFLHQKAKGKLVIAQVQRKNKRVHDALITLREALMNITRAIKLAEKVPDAKNIDETLLHMQYTKGRILIECSCISIGFVPQAVDTCTQLYQMQSNIRHDAYDFTTGTGNDKASFERFKKILLSNSTVHSFDDLNEEEANDLLNRWTGLKFKITKKKRSK